ncbi:DUF4442 domain-containing protein [Antarcticibacterium arcticum]|uniref:DUF4442 domain-containing protein n=1 Tax=Antarcticibacterium arcticum TaxID=2585771 RepID=A0A5B8YH37_9FLAO|nr:DUF4442 domain-containing protein [Antarcticibacterium arcticum]QED37312.1 DUF4442 domain-containing protein [Antarcticibacterium arcticum]
MKLTPGKLNKYLMIKLPSAWLTGVRVISIDNEKCLVGVRHRWINQNPFNSMYFAVQAMAAELSTGALVMTHIQNSGKKISMLVAQNKSVFIKKATGRIQFICNEGHLISGAIEQALTTGEGQTFWMRSRGIDEDGVEVSTFDFEWTIKAKG